MPGSSEQTQKFINIAGDDRTIFSTLQSSAGSCVLRAEKELTFHLCATSDIGAHTHENYYELLIVTGGKLLHHLGTQSTALRTGDALLLCPGQRHKLSAYKQYASRHINLTCSPSVMAQVSGIPSTNQWAPTRPWLHLRELEYRIVADLQESIFKSDDQTYQYSAVRTLLHYLVGLFLLPEREPVLSGQMPKWLADFIDHLQTLDFSQPLHLTQLYALSGKPQPTLAKEFKRYTGQTLISYLNGLKLRHASNLLRGTTFSLAEVAALSGFESYPHFSRLFKEAYGLSPQQYRNISLDP